ncbi:WD40-repeat-containing domain protein [Cokeromyces recurvatus]|uniref:WD40-repeat-containing domain protein n=1 Tax=Cokeromyces recurvatus TaxID=90255 RepID=UPI00221F4AB6|nr:WD40-repeat-containing domain protein [Cokeromyces recurvatus]KAI7902357.1 WD40-repeat-containing domain protein [Cokeromyces recurvatus]
MDSYFQSTLAANSLQQNLNTRANNNNNAQPARTVPHFPPTNKEFSATELHTPDGIYSLLHETFYETIAPQFAMGTRVSIASAKDYPADSSEDEGFFSNSLLSMTPIKKSDALPIPNAASSSSRRALRTMSTSSSSIGANASAGLQVLTSPQKLMTTSTSGNHLSPYLPYPSPSYPSTPNPIAPQQIATGSYMMSSSQDLGMSHSPGDFSLPPSFNAQQQQQQQHHHHNNSSIGSLSSLFGRSLNNSNGKLSQSSSSISRSMNTNTTKPKNHLSKTNSTFVLRFLIHENLQKLLATKAFEDDFLFFNIGSSFIWVDSKSKPKEPLSRIVFSKSYPTCHDINETTRCEDHLDIIIGFSTGDIIWYDPLSCKYVRLNKVGSLVSSPVTMIKWIPGSEHLFIAIFKNGTALVMDKDRDDQTFNAPEPSSWSETQFHPIRPHRSNKYNPVSFWRISKQGLTDIAFSPDGVYMALTGMDGQLRIIDYRSERLIDVFSSYYGKLNCVDWSPDGRYILTGGEDDLVTLWSFVEKRLVARCQGHRSWVTGVAFDKWRCDDQNYRFGSVGEDCNLILWDFSYSALQKPKHPRIIASSPPKHVNNLVISVTPSPSPQQTAPVERKKSLKNHRLFRGFTSSDTNSSTTNNNQNVSTNNSTPNGSFSSRFRKRSSRSNSFFSHDYSDDVIMEDQIKHYLPVYHPPLKKNQSAILQPTTIKAIHADPCLSLQFRERTLVTTDRRGRIRIWGRP